MCFGLFSLFLLRGAPRNLQAAKAKLQDNRMTIELNISGLILQQNKTKLEEESTMARYTGPAWKLSRRLGISLSGTGKEIEKRPYAPGQHGPTQRVKLSEYGMQLQEKQKLRFMFGVNERQFRTLFNKAGKMPGKHGENFMILLETRLDNLVYRMGLARTRRASRQLVNHGHVLVDGKRVDIPSFSVKPGQEISLREKSQNLDVVNEALEVNNFVPEYVSFDKDTKVGSFVRMPERSELAAEINEALIVEFYSRK
jgi:small subunit ribosomal protein S4